MLLRGDMKMVERGSINIFNIEKDSIILDRGFYINNLLNYKSIICK